MTRKLAAPNHASQPRAAAPGFARAERRKI